MVVRVSDKNQNYNNVTKLLVKPIIISVHKSFNFIKKGVLITNECFNGTYWRFAFKKGCSY